MFANIMNCRCCGGGTQPCFIFTVVPNNGPCYAGSIAFMGTMTFPDGSTMPINTSGGHNTFPLTIPGNYTVTGTDAQGHPFSTSFTVVCAGGMPGAAYLYLNKYTRTVQVIVQIITCATTGATVVGCPGAVVTLSNGMTATTDSSGSVYFTLPDRSDTTAPYPLNGVATYGQCVNATFRITYDNTDAGNGNPAVQPCGPITTFLAMNAFTGDPCCLTVSHNPVQP